MAKVVYKSGQQVRLEGRTRSKEKGRKFGRRAARQGVEQPGGEHSPVGGKSGKGWTQVGTQPGKGLTKYWRQPGGERKSGRCPEEGLMQVGERSQAGAQSDGRTQPGRGSSQVAWHRHPHHVSLTSRPHKAHGNGVGVP